MIKALSFALYLCSVSSLAMAAEVDMAAPQVPASAPGFAVMTAANFTDLRHTIKELIGTSRKRVWILTDYLTDADVANALYMAKFRKRDVKVFFGRERLNAPSSRAGYLKGQGIQVYLRPKHGFNAQTLLFIDHRLYSLNRDLSSYQRFGNFQLVQASPEEVRNFVVWLREIMEFPEIAMPRSYNRRQPHSSKEPYQGDSEGSYNYDRGGSWRKAPQGISKELPRVPKWKQIQEQRESPPPPPPTPAEEQAAGAQDVGTPENVQVPRPWINPEPLPPPAGSSDEDRTSDPLMEEPK